MLDLELSTDVVPVFIRFQKDNVYRAQEAAYEQAVCLRTTLISGPGEQHENITTLSGDSYRYIASLEILV